MYYYHVNQNTLANDIINPKIDKFNNFIQIVLLIESVFFVIKIFF